MPGPLPSLASAALTVPGRAIAPGLACGPLRRNRPDLAARDAEGCVLLADRAVPDDVGRILASAGTLTLSGAVLSHVSLLSREFGKPSVSLVGITPARFAREGEPFLLVFEDVVGGDGPAVLFDGDIVFLDGGRGMITIPGRFEPAARDTIRRVFPPLAAYAKLPDDPALLEALMTACPAADDVARAFVFDAAFSYRLVPAGAPARRLLAALAARRAGGVREALDRLADGAMLEAASWCDGARSDLEMADDLEELQRAMRRFEAGLDRHLKLLEDIGADPDRLEQLLESVLAAVARRRDVLETRLVAEVKAALAMPDEVLRVRLGGLFRLLRRARAAHLETEAVQGLHRRLTRELAAERARAGTRLVVPLMAGAPRDRSLVGGKASGLIDVLQALPPGARTPRGFVVTSAAYRLHLLGEIGEKLRLAMEAGDDAETSRRARAAILSGEIPEEIVEALSEAHERLAVPRLAVRSSATIEDGPIGSLAGLFDTYLGVTGIDDLLGRVRWAWASLWNGRALAALSATGLSPLHAGLAVLVQEMIPTRSAGVLFSRDPSGRPDTLLVNAAFGLGEGISQGETPGDLYWVRRSSGDLIASETGLATHRIDLAPQGFGTIETALAEGVRASPCLDASDLSRLAELARSVEEITGRAQDIEFGFDADGGLVVFQMRRIVPRRPDGA